MSAPLIALVLATASVSPSTAPTTENVRPFPIVIRIQDVHPQIAGSWIINEPESQRPQESRGQRAPSASMAPMSGGGGGGGGGGRRRGGGGGGGGGGASSRG